MTLHSACGWALVSLLANLPVVAGETITHPFAGITLIRRTETNPRPVTVYLARVDLTEPGLSFELTSPSAGGKRETVRQTTLDFLNERHAQLAVNAHFFVPFPSTEPDSDLVGLAASKGKVYSTFETPAQSYAIVADAPALNLDSSNRPRIVSRPRREWVELWNTVAGSAQIITGGAATIPSYRDEANPLALLAPGGPGRYDTAHSWYAIPNARTIAGLAAGGRFLILLTVDNAGGSRGMTVGEAAEMLIRDYGVEEALNLDGGGSTTMVIEDSETHAGRTTFYSLSFSFYFLSCPSYSLSSSENSAG